MNGKGDKRRPQQAPDKHVMDEWERLFPKNVDIYIIDEGSVEIYDPDNVFTREKHER